MKRIITLWATLLVGTRLGREDDRLTVVLEKQIDGELKRTSFEYRLVK